MPRARFSGVVVCVALLAAACTSSKGTSSTATGGVAAAEARVTTAEANLTAAQGKLTTAHQQFCEAGKDYVTALDRYGKVFSDAQATVGDVTTAGADLVAPRGSTESAIAEVTTARDGVASAQQELADANAALAAAKATASSVSVASSTVPAVTTTTIVSQLTINRVEQAESDLANTAKGITDQTPVAEAGVEFNSAAFALEVTWLQLLVEAGCLSDQQQAEAVAKVRDYTLALQNELSVAGYYTGKVDGIYGPETLDAVKKLQTDNGLPATGLVDRATAAALDKKVQAIQADAATQSLTQTAALQSVLKVAGYWTGAIDGKWTPELTAALKTFQTALGVAPTGAVDAATLNALEQTIAKAKSTSGTSTPSPTTAAASG